MLASGELEDIEVALGGYGRAFECCKIPSPPPAQEAR